VTGDFRSRDRKPLTMLRLRRTAQKAILAKKMPVGGRIKNPGPATKPVTPISGVRSITGVNYRRNQFDSPRQFDLATSDRYGTFPDIAAPSEPTF
jgi:hypothetical protein